MLELDGRAKVDGHLTYKVDDPYESKDKSGRHKNS